MPTPGFPAPRRAYAALPLAWASLVLLLTLTPAQNMPTTPVWELLSFDTAAHAGVFAVLAGLSWFSLSRQRRWPRAARHAGLVVLAGSVFFGGLIEALQRNMRLGRHGEWTDLLSDGLGAALAVGAAAWWARRKARRARPLAPVWAGLLLAGLAPPPAQAQDLPRARRTIAKLAATGMHGRGYVRQGERKAAAYLRGRLRELKLEPLAPDYTQPFTLDVNIFPGKLRLRFSIAGKQLPAPTPGRDFIASAHSGSGSLHSMPLVVLDTTIFAGPLPNAVARQQLQKQPLANKALLLTARDASRLRTLPVALQQHLDSAAAKAHGYASRRAAQAHRDRSAVASTRKPSGHHPHGPDAGARAG